MTLEMLPWIVARATGFAAFGSSRARSSRDSWCGPARRSAP